ncbi:MAG: Obg family GTPase CgtA, partial [Bacilli bacterium]
GDEFLKHIERTKVIAHVIDMSAFEGRNPYEDYVIINKELEDFNPQLLKKPMIIIANKMDMESSKDNLKEFKKKVKLPIYEISAIKNQGLDQVLLVLADMLDATPDQPLFKEEAFEDFVLYKFKQEKPFTITKESGEFIVRGDTVEKLLKMTKFNTTDGTFHFMNKLKYLGIDEELKKLGVKEGDTVRILNHLFEYKD